MTPRVVQGQMVFGVAALVATMGFGASQKVRDVPDFDHKQVIDYRGSDVFAGRTPILREVRITCERRRKDTVGRNARELARCQEDAKTPQPWNVGQFLTLGGSATLMGIGFGILFTAPDRRLGKRVILGALVGLGVGTSVTYAAQASFRAYLLRSGAEFCTARSRDMATGSIPEDYENCLARGREDARARRSLDPDPRKESK